MAAYRATNAADYKSAFLNHSATMGCPTDAQDADSNDCVGCNLAGNLDQDFDSPNLRFSPKSEISPRTNGDERLPVKDEPDKP